MGVSNTSGHVQTKIKMPNPSQEPPASCKAPNQDMKDNDGLWTFKSRKRAKIQNMGVLNTSDHIQIKIKMPNPSQEPAVSSKAQNRDLKDMDVLCRDGKYSD